MRPVLSREQMQAFEAQAIAAGVPGLVLMENAGRGAAHLIGLRGRSHQPRSQKEGAEASPTKRGVGGSCVRCADERALSQLSVGIVCGPGNNGGDGFVVGRHLLGRSANVKVVLCVSEDSLKGDARSAYLSFLAVGGQIERAAKIAFEPWLAGCDLVVDALLGTGASRPVEGQFAEIVAAMNDSGRPIVALDVPSGLDADKGEILGTAVRAEHTVTFGHLKTGLLTTQGYETSGRITVSHIGVPASLPESVRPAALLVEEADIAGAIPRRSVSAHKKNTGHVAVVGGSPGMVGALRLAGIAALRTGAGLCTLVSVSEVIDQLERSVLELMTRRQGAENAEESASFFDAVDALVIGPGLGRDKDALQRVRQGVLANKPTVIDADGLRALEGHTEELRGHPALVLTPHVGEASGLLGCSSAEVEQDRYGAVRRLVERTGATVVLKGPRTLIGTPGGSTCVSVFGTPALASGGTGDVLSGVVAALLAVAERQGESALSLRERSFQSAWLGVGLHGLAAEAWSHEGGDAGMVASDLLEWIPRVMKRLVT